VTVDDVLAGAREGVFPLLPGDLLSPLVHEAAQRRGIALVPAADPSARRLRLILWRPTGRADAARLVRTLEGYAGIAGAEDWTVAAPWPYLRELRRRPFRPGLNWAVFSPAAWDQGAYTGEVSARMAVDMGASACVLGLPDASATPEERALVPQRTGRALAHGLVPYVGVALDVWDFEGARVFARIREEIDAVRGAAGEEAARIRWFWCHPAGPVPRLAAPEEYVGTMAEILRAPGSVGAMVPAGREVEAAFRVEEA
jgi:hypothetical protein